MKWNRPILGHMIEQSLLLVPTDPGVYCWRRVLRFSDQANLMVEQAQQEISDAVSKPYLRVERGKVAASGGSGLRANLIEFGDISVGGGSLTAAKTRTLNDGLLDDSLRFLLGFLEESSMIIGPVLYVGKASRQDGGLQSRIGEHIHAGSPLERALRDFGLNWNEVVLLTCPLPELSEDQITLVEQILTHFSFAPLTKRPG